MAPRAISSGTITFGLVAVPVKLYSGTQAKTLHFNMLHATDKARLRQQYVCTKCEEVVGRDDTVRGYEYAKDQYAVLTPDELKALEQQSDQSIEIEEFVPIERVDPIGSLKGAPGLYADAPSQPGGGSELYYDNIKIYPNKK